MNAQIERVNEQSIAWMALAQSGRMSSHQQQRFDAWLYADPLHLQTWQRLQECLGAQFGALRQLDRRLPNSVGQGRELLLEPAPSRRQVLRGILGMGVSGVALWAVSETEPVQVLWADFSTSIGQRRTFELHDGSQLHIDADSAVNVANDTARRQLTLLKGQMMIEIAANPVVPFVIRSDDASIQAADACLLVSRTPIGTRVVVLKRDAIAAVASSKSQRLREGQAAMLRPDGILTLPGDQHHQADWLQGKLSVIGEPLEAVIQALRPYTRGMIHVSPTVSDIPVQGVFNLDVPGSALTLLTETLPIEVRHFGPWMTWVGARA